MPTGSVDGAQGGVWCQNVQLLVFVSRAMGRGMLAAAGWAQVLAAAADTPLQAAVG